MIETIVDKRIVWLVRHIVKDDDIIELRPYLDGGKDASLPQLYSEE